MKYAKALAVLILTITFPVPRDVSYVDQAGFETVTMNNDCYHVNTNFVVELRAELHDEGKVTCTGALVHSKIVTTAAICCTAVKEIKVYAEYKDTMRRWAQTAEAETMNIYQTEAALNPSYFLCVIKLKTGIDMLSFGEPLSYYFGVIDQEMTLDVIAVLNSGSQSIISCGLAELEKNALCRDYYQDYIDNTTWFRCITNAFAEELHCDSASGALIQWNDYLVGITREYIENCSSAKYSFFYDLSDNLEFIEMINLANTYNHWHSIFLYFIIFVWYSLRKN